jgi:ABC-type transporter Mla subunit MlaD
MATNDLTPQLRTRLSRLEKFVGWFVTIATLLLLAGLALYVYKLAENKGWFATKAPYYTYLKSAGGIKPGDKVHLMGKEAGEITLVKPMPPGLGDKNIYVEFALFDENIGYVWDDSVVLVKSAGFLGARYLEVTKGGTSGRTNLHETFKQQNGALTAVLVPGTGTFTNWHKGGAPFELIAEEPPELSSQLDQTVQMLKVSLTNILQLTNALTKTLTNAAEVTANLNEILLDAKPVVRNAAAITENLKQPRGSLGEWLFPTNMNSQIVTLLTNANLTVANANSAVTNANTNLVTLFSNVTVNLENLARMTSNLNAQVQANTNIVTSVSDLIVHTDDMIQGLKRHWLLRSAFKKKDGAKAEEKSRAPEAPRSPAPKGAGRE